MQYKTIYLLEDSACSYKYSWKPKKKTHHTKFKTSFDGIQY